MRRSVGRANGTAKTGRCQIRQSKSRNRQSISPVMQKVRDLLPATKAAHHLHILTDAPVSTLKKVLCGQRSENLDLFLAMLRSDLGRDVLFAAMGDATPAWFVRYRKQLDVDAVRRQLAESQKLIERLQAEAAE